MTRKKLLWFLLAEFAAAALAVFWFKMLPNRYWAAVLAGSGFVSLGLGIVWSLRHHPRKNKFFTYWAAWIHLFMFSAPMLLYRLWMPGADWEMVRIFSFTGPQFHQASEKFYLALMLATMIDRIRFRRFPD